MWEISAFSWLYYKNLSWCTVTWTLKKDISNFREQTWVTVNAAWQERLLFTFWHSWHCCCPWNRKPNTDELRHGHLMSSLFSSSYDVHTDRPPCQGSVTTSCNTAPLHKQGSRYLHHGWSLNCGYYSQDNFIHILGLCTVSRLLRILNR